MTDALSLDALLSHRPLGRILQPDGVGSELMLIREAWLAGGKPFPTSKDFHAVGRGSGTHLLKLITPRASSAQAVLRFQRPGSNRMPEWVPSIDAKKAKVAKIVFRPLEVAGHPARHIVDHILNPDDLSLIVLDAFSAAFGSDALNALRAGLVEPLSVTRLPVGEFPIVFLPRPGGGDLQATPISPAEAYVRMNEVTAAFFVKRAVGGPRPRWGRWHRQNLTAQPRNISSAVGPLRTRFLATMPKVLDREHAELFHAVLGGLFPSWRDDAVTEVVLGYADLLDREVEYSNADIRAGRDRRAIALIAGAQAFLEEIDVAATELLLEIKTDHPSAALPKPPKIAEVILWRFWPNNSFDPGSAGRSRVTTFLAG